MLLFPAVTQRSFDDSQVFTASLKGFGPLLIFNMFPRASFGYCKDIARQDYSVGNDPAAFPISHHVNVHLLLYRQDNEVPYH